MLAVDIPQATNDPSYSISLGQDAPVPSHSQHESNVQSSSEHQGTAADNSCEVNPFALQDDEPFENVFAPEFSNDASSSEESNSPISVHYPQPHEHLRKWTNDHPIDNIIGNPSRPVTTRKQLATDAFWCFFNSILSKTEPKDFKDALSKECWLTTMQ